MALRCTFRAVVVVDAVEPKFGIGDVVHALGDGEH